LNDDLKSYKLVSIHKNSTEEVQFEINEESDGTQRLIDIMPGIIDVILSDKVYIIDEIDRSLHTEITKSIIKYFYLEKAMAN